MAELHCWSGPVKDGFYWDAVASNNSQRCILIKAMCGFGVREPLGPIAGCEPSPPAFNFMESPENTGPQNLRKAFGMLGGMKQQVRNRTKKASKGLIVNKDGKVSEWLPRQTCDICATCFDFALIPADSPVSVGRCADCKEKLSTGHYAVVSSKGYAIIAATGQFSDMGGKVVRVTPDNFDKIQAKYGKNSNPSTDPSANN